MTYNGSCYDSFPVTSSSFSDIRFLEPRRRSLTRTGSVVHCHKATNETYVADKENTLWHLRNATFRKVEKYNVSLGDDMIGLTKIASYGAHLQHYESEMPSRMSLLRLLARNQEVMKQLEDFRVHGHGSVLHGIGSLLGSAIHSLASGGSLIIKTIGEGLRDTFHGVGDLDEKVVGSIANATSNVIGASASGASEILDSIGGPANIVLYALVLGLYAYLIYSRWGKPSPFTIRFNSGNQNSGEKITKIEDDTDEQTEQTFKQKEKRRLLHPTQNKPMVRHIRTNGGPESTIYTPMWC